MGKMKRILFILILSLSNVVFGQQPVTDLGFVAASGFDYLIVGGGGAGGYGNSNEGGGLSLIHI